MSIKLKLSTPTKQIQKMADEQITEYLNSKIRKNYSRVANSLRQKIPFWIRSQPEIQSLLSEGVPGSLNAAFGLYSGDASRAVFDIIEAVKEATVINIQKINRRYTGTVEFNFQPADFMNILSLKSGYVITEKGTGLHWLDWLIAKGDTVIVIGYEYEPSDLGRSGGGTMAKGTSFRVPPQYSGTLENNFIVRALSNREKEINPVVQRLFE